MDHCVQQPAVWMARLRLSMVLAAWFPGGGNITAPLGELQAGSGEVWLYALSGSKTDRTEVKVGRLQNRGL